MDIMNMSVEAIWEELERRAAEQPEDFFSSTAGTAQFTIKDDEERTFMLQIVNGKASLAKDTIEDADCSFEISVDSFKKLLAGSLNATTAFMTGRLKVKGNMQLALQLERLLKKLMTA